MSAPGRNDEFERDPRLEAALRHAPDAGLRAPPLLSARIIAAAQRSAEEAKRRQPWWKRLDAWLTPARLGGAGTAAAAVLAATVLWVGRDEQPAAPDLRPAPSTDRATRADQDRRAPAASPTELAQAPSVSGAPTAPVPATPTPVAPARPSTPHTHALGTTAPAAPAPAGPEPRPSATADAAAANAARNQGKVERAIAESAEAERAAAERAEAARRESQRTDARQRAAADAAAAAAAQNAAPPAPASPPPPPPPPAVAAAPAPTPFPASPPAATAGAQRAFRSPPADSLAGSRQAAPPLVEGWLQSTDTARWQQRREADTSPSPLPAGWLAELAAATRGRWQAVDERAAEARSAGGEGAGGVGGGSRTSAGAAGWLTLVQPGGASVRLLLATAGVTVCDVASGRCEQARLEAAQAQALQRALLR